jgi:hypothetical protein
MKVELEIDHNTVSSMELVDQLMLCRLSYLLDEQLKWKDEPEIEKAIKTLMDWMTNRFF